MVLSWKLCWVNLLFLTFIQVYCTHFENSSQPDDHPIVNLSTSWTNSPSNPNSMNFRDGSTVRSIIFRGSSGLRFACGFYCNGNCDTYLFAIFIVSTDLDNTYNPIGFPAVVWSANRDYPVRTNATLQLTSEGDLVLRDVDGTLAWASNTAGKSVVGFNLTENGNLVLFNKTNATVWQSFDHPTDSLLPGQKLVSGQKLTASVSGTNWSTRGGLYSLSVTSVSKTNWSTQEGLFAFIGSNPSQAYFRYLLPVTIRSNEPSYIKFRNGSLALYLEGEQSEPSAAISVPLATSVQYMRLEPDGHLRVFEWDNGWKLAVDPLSVYLSNCDYPMVCGEYGICNNGQCSCPVSNNGTTYFKQISDKQPELGCSETTPLTCEASQFHQLLELKDITYFELVSYLTYTDVESCKQACLQNCSCKAALFQYDRNSSFGYCYLPSKIFSLQNNEKDKTRYVSSAFVKVQISQNATGHSATGQVAIVVGSSLGAVFGLFIIIGILVFLLWKKSDAYEAKEDYLHQVPGLPTRFSYEELKATTEIFSKKLGEGGFGSVFEGTLSIGTKVAVKRLDGLDQIKKSFLAEVETIGSIHHFNLVRLIGFCDEKFHKLLVYEYMCNGSLDKWIFHKNQELALDWQHRRKIILDIAKGLAYLHEDCRQKIVHLDIKPQNILLDETFNAKVSDFGLAKLIDKDQSQIMTTMRGTPGYLAPEWLSSVITEKVDVYSYGVVVLEILCGRKNLDRSQPEEQMHLLSLFEKKAEEGQLLDLVDKHSEDMQLHGEEIVEMMSVAAWCLQSDFAKRPSMSMVVKVLEGVMDIEQDLDYSFSNPPLVKSIAEVGRKEVNFCAETPLLPSVLSGPR